MRNDLTRELLRVSWLFALAIGVLVTGFYLLPANGARVVFMDVAAPMVGLLAAGFLFGVAVRVRRQSARFALAWAAIGAGVLFAAIGDLVWAYLELVLRHPPFPSLADAFYVLYYPAVVLGAVLLVFRRLDSRTNLGMSMDVAIVVAAIALITWNSQLAPAILESATMPTLNRIILLGYPLGDLALLAALLTAIYGRSRHEDLASILVITAALITAILTDYLYSYQSLADNYVSGTALDFGWLAGYTLTALAALPQWSRRHVEQGAASPVPALLVRWVAIIRTYLPYAALLGCYFVLSRTTPEHPGLPSLGLGTGLGIVVALVLMRQIVTHLENSRLTHQLSSKADQLEGTNRDLAVEITERKRVEEKLSYDALHDSMTGLPNRALFLDRLGQAIEHAGLREQTTCAVLFVDMDHFKVVNDSLGHLVGDQLLVAIGARLRETLRLGDTLARFGGDEFAILMETGGQDDAAHRLAERIQVALQRPFELQGRQLHTSASIGIVTDFGAYRGVEELMRDADLALYEAKAQGKARFESFDIEMRQQAHRRLELEEELRVALRDQQLRVYYQPIYALGGNGIAAFEALVRWQHPQRGLVLPHEFLPVAEDSGLIVPIGDHVLRQACLQLQKWRTRHPALSHVHINVNISTRQFTRPALLDSVAEALRLSGLPANSLRLEISERVLIGNLRLANQVFEGLRRMGVGLEIDDFGIGYSSLAYLQRFPIDALKIDRSFIEIMCAEAKGLGMVRAILSLAREMGMEAIAEGIETTDQLNALRALVCQYGQGWLLSRPLEPGQVEDLLSLDERLAPEQPPGSASAPRTV